MNAMEMTVSWRRESWEDEVGWAKVEVEEEEEGRTEQNPRGEKPKRRGQGKNACLDFVGARQSMAVDASRRVDSPPKWILAGEARSERGIDDKKPSHSTTADVSTKEPNASEWRRRGE
jgi:hypothetical protein